jgi:hypothetical protein
MLRSRPRQVLILARALKIPSRNEKTMIINDETDKVNLLLKQSTGTPVMMINEHLETLLKSKRTSQVIYTQKDTGGSYFEMAQTVFRQDAKNYPFAQLQLPDEDIIETIEKLNSSLPNVKFSMFMTDGDIIANKKSKEEQQVEEWKLLACKSTLHKINFDWESPQLTRFVSDLINNLPNLNNDQLQTCITYLSRIHRYKVQPKNIKRLVRALDDRCLKVIEEQHFEKPLILRLCFLWFKAGLVINNEDIKDWANFLKFSNEALSHLVNDQTILDSLTPKEFVFVMFFIGIHRHIPNATLQPFRTKAGFQIPTSIETKIGKSLPSLTIQELGILASTLHMCNMRLQTKNVRLTNQFMDALVSIPDGQVIKAGHSIGSLAKILQDRGKFNDVHIQLLATKFRPYLDHMSFLNKGRLLQLIMSNAPAKMDGFLKDFVTSIKQELRGKRLKDLEKLAFTLFYLNYPDKTIFNDILKAMDSCDKSDARSGRSFVFLNAFIAKAGLINEENLEEILVPANASEALHNAVTIDDHLDAGLIYLFGLRQPSNSPIPETVATRERLRSTGLNINALLHLGELDCNLEIDFTGYSGTRLDKSLRAKFLKLAMFQTQANSVDEKLRGFVYEELCNILGQSKVHYGLLMPHAKFKDFVVCLKGNPKDLNALELPLDYLKLITKCQDIIKPEPIKDCSWHIIVLPRQGFFDQGGGPYGPVRHKIDQLTTLGYKVTLVKPSEARKWRDVDGSLSKHVLGELLPK